MVRRTVHLVITIAWLVLLLSPIGAAQSPSPETQGATGSPSALIIENVGQWDPAARFQARGGPGTTWLAEDGIWITLLEPAPADDARDRLQEREAQLDPPRKGVALRLSFEGANPHPTLVPFGPSETVVSYFLGNDPDQWHADVPVWTGVRYVDLYPGLDLEIGGAAGGWAWRFVAKVWAQQATPLQKVRLRVEGAEGLSLDETGLRVQTAVGEVMLPPLEAVDAEGATVALPEGGPQQDRDTLTAPFTSAMDAAAPAGAPSAMIYSTYLGGSGSDKGYGVTLDTHGRAFITGECSSTDYPTTPGAFDPSHNGGSQLVVSALEADGSALVYSTFLGGTSTGNIGHSIALDGRGRAWVTGYTNCTDYPTTAGAIDRSHNGGADVVVSALSASGTVLVYSTFLGGSGDDFARSIALDADGQVYITGDSASSNYPTTLGAFDPAHNGLEDVVVSVLRQDDPALVYSTYMGGPQGDWGLGIAVDGDGQACLVGYTGSSTYPTTLGAFDTVKDAWYDIVVSKLSADGSALVYSTFLGGSGDDLGNAIALNGAGQAYITGFSNSSDYPTTAGAYDTAKGGPIDSGDGVVSALSPDGSTLMYSTYLGGSYSDQGNSIALDGQGRAYITGICVAVDYPVTAGAFDTGYNEGWDVVVSVLGADGSDLVYSTFLGGASHERGNGIALGNDGRVCIVGHVMSSDYPTTAGAFDRTYNGSWDFAVSALAIHTSTHFAPATEWWDGLKNWAPQNRYPRMTGDVDGDGDDDVVAFNPDSGAWVALSNGSALQKPVNWSSDFAWLQGQYNWRAMGDVTGDGKDDIVGLSFHEGIYVARSNGTSFEACRQWTDALKDWGPQGEYPKLVGNPDGDSKDDIVAINPSTGVWVARSSYDAFNTPQLWSAETGWMSDSSNWVALGDVDGDGDDDLVNFRYGEGVYVARSTGKSYDARTLWWNGLKYWGPDGRYPRLVGDVTGDGKADIVAYDPDRGGYVGVSTGLVFIKPVLWTSDFAIRPNTYYLHALGDMNGDGREDAVLFWYGEGVYVGLSDWE